MGLFAAWHLVDRSLPSDRLVKQPSSEAEHHAWRQLPGFGRDKHGQRMQPIPLQQLALPCAFVLVTSQLRWVLGSHDCIRTLLHDPGHLCILQAAFSLDWRGFGAGEEQPLERGLSCFQARRLGLSVEGEEKGGKWA